MIVLIKTVQNFESRNNLLLHESYYLVSKQSIMEEVLLRFPHVGKQIFENLGNESLGNCGQVNTSWNMFIDNEKFSWIRKIRFCSLELDEPLENILRYTRLDVVKELAEVALNFCKVNLKSSQVDFCSFEDQKYDLERREAGHFLHFAAMIGHEEFFRENTLSKFFLRNPEFTSTNYEDDRYLEHTPLHFAAIHGHFSVCQLIIENHMAENPIHIQYIAHDPLWEAYNAKHFGICKLIIENLIDKNPGDHNQQYTEHQNTTALHAFAEVGHMEICKIIVESIRNDIHPTDRGGQTPFHVAAFWGHSSICKLIIEHFDDKNPIDQEWRTPLHIAAENGNLDICEIIINHLKKDAHPTDNKGRTPFHLAALKGHLSICKLIIGHFDVKNPVNPSDQECSTPLHMAAENANWAVCKLILEYLINKNPQYYKDGTTALHKFAQAGQWDICEIIIKSIQKDEHPTDNVGRTPFHLAAAEGHSYICTLISEHFADKNPVDQEWLTPLHIAAKNGNWTICKLIMDNFKDSPMAYQQAWDIVRSVRTDLTIDRLRFLTQ